MAKQSASKLQGTIPALMLEKINYLHHRFSSTEWSGPAWYTIKKKAKTGFPTQVELSYFKPIDLGNTWSTELDGEELG